MSSYTARDARTLSLADLGGAMTFLLVLVIVVFWQSSRSLGWDDVVLSTIGYVVPWVVLIASAFATILLTHVKRPASWVPVLAIVLLSVLHGVLGSL
ncbi:MAG: hypothetical protein QM635_11865 [Microbacteriaceae bacterium]